MRTLLPFIALLSGCPAGDDTAGSDTQAQSECALNSGWPCSCDGVEPLCEDGSSCVWMKGLGSETLGLCTPECDPKAPECPDTDFSGQGECAAQGSKATYCVLTCAEAADCPPDQECIPVSGGSVCYAP